MIAKSYILANLRWLEKKYDKASSQREALMYSKLAILELCGWLEESMDDVIKRAVNKHIKISSYRNHLLKDVIDKNYGFEYKKHFRNMIVQIIGFKNFEKLERKIDPRTLANFQSTIGNLKTVRNSEAHTHIKGLMKQIDAPSITIRNFNNLYEGLIQFDKNLKLVR